MHQKRSIVRSALFVLIPLLRIRGIAKTVTPPAPMKFGDITFSGNLRARLYGWDWFQPASGDNTYAYSGNLLRLGFSQNRSRWDWNAEFGVPFMLGLPAN